MNRQLFLGLASTGLLCVAQSGYGQYQQVASLSELNNSTAATGLSGVATSGTQVYSILNGDNLPRIVTLDGTNPAGTFAEVTSTAQYQAENPGDTFISSANFLGVDGGNLFFTDIPTDSIYSADIATGVVTTRIDNAGLETATGGSGRIGRATTAGPGELFFYDSSADGLFSLSGSTITTEATSAQLTAAIGNDSVSGLTAIGGTAYVGSNTSDNISAYDLATDTATEILSTADITALTGQTAAGFTSFVAIGNTVYAYETSSDSILSFDVSDPTGTLAFTLTDAQLAAGAAGSDFVSGLLDYNGQLGFFVGSGPSSAVRGVYAVPEPTTAALVALGGLAMLRRRRSA